MTDNNDEYNGLNVATCENCPYWVKSNALEDITNRTGECRSQPPQMIATPVQTDQGMGLNIQSMFPRTGSKGWCAQHPLYRIEHATNEALEVSEALTEMAAQMMLSEDAPLELDPKKIPK